MVWLLRALRLTRLSVPRRSILLFAASALMAPGPSLSEEIPLCEPSEQIRQEVEKASAPLAAEKAPLEQVIEPLRDLRKRFPGDLFVHVRYQDAVNQRGVEGHLKEMFEEYLALRNDHADNILYQYLYGRVLEGRTTPQAISVMEGVLKRDPRFAPAHRTLAEIYGSRRFRDPRKERAERAEFQKACPGSTITGQPPPLPPRGDLSKAERLIGREEAKERVPELVFQAFQQDQWRLQRIRPFDWYTVAEKKQVGRQAQMAQWKGWSILVKHYMATQQEEKAQQLLSEMKGRFERVRWEQDPDHFWTAGWSLLDLYVQRKQVADFSDVAARMDSFLAAKPNVKRASQLARLRSRFPRKRSQSQPPSR